MLWKSWNDQLSIILIVGIPILWIINKWVPLPSEVIGASIVAWTLVVQFFFRKFRDETNSGG